MEYSESPKAFSSTVVTADGNLTRPRSYGVYQLPRSSDGARTFRFGNHPVRQAELDREFGSSRLIIVFLDRQDAVELAGRLNAA